jgi:8-oxo-dGTP pyrophosphatase MutT (NUDIX family)
MDRITRYQGAIIKDHHVLLLRNREHNTGRSYWLFPGGSIEVGETEEQCVAREMLEETGLTVKVEKLLFTQPMPQLYGYTRRKIIFAVSWTVKPNQVTNLKKTQVCHPKLLKLSGSIYAT